MANPRTKSWNIGDVKVTRLYEAEDKPDVSFLLHDATVETVKKHAWLKPHFVTDDWKIIVWFQAFALTVGNRRIMVDTCIGNGKIREYEFFTNTQTSFLEDLTEAGYPPESIDTVLCTHMHLDHVGWNTRKVNGKWVPTFPNARYLFARNEFEYWKSRLPERSDPHKSVLVEHVVDSVLPILDAELADFVEPNHRVSEHLWFEPTPGHTPGHVSVHIESRGQHAVISGDIFHHPVQFAEPDMPSAFCIDAQKACLTRREFLSRWENRKAFVIGSHFCDPTAGWIEREARNWRFSTE